MCVCVFYVILTEQIAAWYGNYVIIIWINENLRYYIIVT